MADDLVTRLRESDNWLCEEAADALEALEAERDRLRGALEDLQKGAQHVDVGHEDFRAAAMQITWNALNSVAALKADTED